MGFLAQRTSVPLVKARAAKSGTASPAGPPCGITTFKASRAQHQRPKRLGCQPVLQGSEGPFPSGSLRLPRVAP